MLDGRLDRHEEVLAPVQHQRRRVKALQQIAQRALIGVVEVARVGDVEQRAAERPEVRHAFAQRDEPGKLRSVHRAIQPVIAEQFQLLHADRGEQGQRRDAPRLQSLDLEPHTSAHAETHDVDAVEPQPIEPLQHVAGVRANRIIRHAARRIAEAGQVRGQHAAPLGERRCHRLELVRAARAAVQQDDRSRGRCSLAPLAVGDVHATLATCAVDRAHTDEWTSRRRFGSRPAHDVRGGEQREVDQREDREQAGAAGSRHRQPALRT